MQDIYREVGDHIRERRRKLGLTLEDLEQRSGLSASYIGQVERNVKKASLLSVGLIAAALGVKPASFFGGDTPIGSVPLTERIEAVINGSTQKERAFILKSMRHLAKGLRDFRAV